MIAILTATKITNKDVVKASTLLEKILRFKKFPKRPPIKTAVNNGQYSIISLKITSLVNWPKIPDTELTNINNDAVVMIFLGSSALSKKRIGLKKIPPPIPTIPEIIPRIDPIKTEIKKPNFLIIKFLSE